MGIVDQYSYWLQNAAPELVVELQSMSDTQKEDAFCGDLVFGTGGLRGIIGAGTNRMNVHTVAKVSQGLANYITKTYPDSLSSIAISYDSRIKSDSFAKTAASVFSANNIHVYLYSQLMPTPCLSYAVRALGCVAGVMITASHNPAKYNGYKVYAHDGCQITTDTAHGIFLEIAKLDIFTDIHEADFEAALAAGNIEWIPETVYSNYISDVQKQSMLENESVDYNISIIYSPLNGAGLQPVLRTLRESNFNNIIVVREQENPDGHFPTCQYPNPEIRETMTLGMEYAKKYNADLLLATDPDCDRIGIAVKNKAGEYTLLSGNETGMLLFDFICSQRIKNEKMPSDPVMIKTIVTTDMAEQIAEHYGVRTINVLTGFKFIGEQIGYLEDVGKVDSYVFGFEESYGYLSGTYVRDKDAVNGALLICEMFTYYASKRTSLLEKLDELYQQYGYCLNTLYTYSFEGSTSFTKMQEVMNKFRQPVKMIGGKRVERCFDYSQGIDGLPRADVMKFFLEDHCSLVVRPSGTEPKLKLYIAINAKNRDEAMEINSTIINYIVQYYKLP